MKHKYGLHSVTILYNIIYHITVFQKICCYSLLKCYKYEILNVEDNI